MTIFKNELIYAEFLRRDVQRRRQELDELWSAYPPGDKLQALEQFTITSVAPAAPSPPADSIPPTAPPSIANTTRSSINTTTRSSINTTSEPLKAPPARCSTEGHSQDDHTQVLVAAAPTSTSTQAVMGAEEEGFTTEPTRCSAYCYNHVKHVLAPWTAVSAPLQDAPKHVQTLQGDMLATASKPPPTLIHAQVVFDDVQQRYSINPTSEVVVCVVPPWLATRVWSVQKLEGINLPYSVLLQTSSATVVDRGPESYICNVEEVCIHPKPPWSIVCLAAVQFWLQFSFEWITRQLRPSWPPPKQPEVQCVGIQPRPPPWPFFNNDLMVVYSPASPWPMVKPLFGNVCRCYSVSLKLEIQIKCYISLLASELPVVQQFLHCVCCLATIEHKSFLDFDVHYTDVKLKAFMSVKLVMCIAEPTWCSYHNEVQCQAILPVPVYTSLSIVYWLLSRGKLSWVLASQLSHILMSWLTGECCNSELSGYFNSYFVHWSSLGLLQIPWKFSSVGTEVSILVTRTDNLRLDIGEIIFLSQTSNHLFIISYNKAVTIQSFLLLVPFYSLAYNDKLVPARPSKCAMHKHGDTTKLQSYIFTSGSEIRQLPDVEMHIHTTVGLPSLLLEWHSAVFQMQFPDTIHAIMLSTGGECSSKGKASFVKSLMCNFGILGLKLLYKWQHQRDNRITNIASLLISEHSAISFYCLLPVHTHSISSITMTVSLVHRPEHLGSAWYTYNQEIQTNSNGIDSETCVTVIVSASTIKWLTCWSRNTQFRDHFLMRPDITDCNTDRAEIVLRGATTRIELIWHNLTYTNYLAYSDVLTRYVVGHLFSSSMSGKFLQAEALKGLSGMGCNSHGSDLRSITTSVWDNVQAQPKRGGTLELAGTTCHIHVWLAWSIAGQMIYHEYSMLTVQILSNHLSFYIYSSSNSLRDSEAGAVHRQHLNYQPVIIWDPMPCSMQWVRQLPRRQPEDTNDYGFHIQSELSEAVVVKYGNHANPSWRFCEEPSKTVPKLQFYTLVIEDP